MNNLAYKLKKISKMNKSVVIRKLFSFDEVFTVGYRRRKNDILPVSGFGEFDLVFTDKNYWYADPILFTDNGVSYLFIELFDKKADRGKIAYCTLTDQGPTPFKVVIDEPFHMSFPMTFRFDGDIYMLPETSQDKSLRLYKAISFPDKWELVKRFETSELLVDTVVTHVSEKSFGILACESNPDKEYECRFLKFEITKDNPGEFSIRADKDFNSIQKFDLVSRNGGPIFDYDGKRYIAAQESSFSEYGLYMNYYEYDESIKNIATDCKLNKLSTKNFILHGAPKGEGIHSYCFNDDYEIIDLKYMEFSPSKYFRKISRRFKK